MIGLKSEQKILVPNSVHTRPGEENSEKKIAKKCKKLKNPIPALFLVKTGRYRPRKKKKNLIPNSVHKIPRKIEKKNQKMKYPLSQNIFSQDGMRLAEIEGKKF